MEGPIIMGETPGSCADGSNLGAPDDSLDESSEEEAVDSLVPDGTFRPIRSGLGDLCVIDRSVHVAGVARPAASA